MAFLACVRVKSSLMSLSMPMYTVVDILLLPQSLVESYEGPFLLRDKLLWSDLRLTNP